MTIVNHNMIFYFSLKKSKVVGDEVCHCIRDVENNGVIRMLRLIALKVRFGIDSGQNLAFFS